MPLFVGDFLAATATWTGPERGLYLQLLAFQWSSGPLPCSLETLALALHYTPEEFNRLWPRMQAKFLNGDGLLRNLRLEEHRLRNAEVQASMSKKGTAAANARWHARSNAPRIPQALPEAMPDALIRQCPTMPSDPIRSDPKETSEALVSKRPTARAARSPATYMPEDFSLTPDRREYAVAQKLPDPERTFQNFYGYWFNRSDAKGKHRNWDLTWQRWCREEADRVVTHGKPKQTRFDQLQEG